MNYAKNYEHCCHEPISAFQRWFIRILARRAREIGQSDHKIWSLKWVLDNYFQGCSALTVLDCGAWNGWFLSYNTPVIRTKIAMDFDSHFAAKLAGRGIWFVLADMEKGHFPLANASVNLLAMTSTLEHLSPPEHIAKEIRRVLKPGGVTFITVPDIQKYKFNFWNDITHKRPYTAISLRFLFETHGLETLELSPYNHNLFIAGNLFGPRIHRWLMRRRANALLYVGRKPDR